MAGGDHRHTIPIQFELNVRPRLQTRTLSHILWNDDLSLSAYTMNHTLQV